ncbi:MAG: polyprenyl diphosphate synthase [Legionella sp.]|nr:polyprenyl diphosphate synthase [Legionella sp.]
MNEKIPRHVAIVMDGNGRWAENRGLLRIEGHRAGVSSVKTIIRCCLEKNIPILSLFAFSSENWARPEPEVEFLMQLFFQALKQEVEELHQHGVSLRFTGCREGLSSSLIAEMEGAEQLTAINSRLILNVVINYGGRWEIVHAAKIIAEHVRDGKLALDEVNETRFAEYLNTQGLPDPDLFIRTSGEQRISNFFLWQLAYTELYFSEAHWPDFNADEFEIALTSFRQRERRYGKISPSLNESDHV